MADTDADDLAGKIARLVAVNDDMVARVLGLEFLVAILLRNRFQDAAVGDRERMVTVVAEVAHDTILRHPGVPDDIRAELARGVGAAVEDVCRQAAAPGPFADVATLAMN